MPFSQWARSSETEEGAKDIEQADAFDDQRTRDFLPDVVSSDVTVSMDIERSMIALSQTEYTRVMMAKPNSRMPKVPCMQLPREGSTGYEPTYVFQDPLQPFRRVTLRTRLSDVRSTARLAGADHAYERQGQHILEAGIRDRSQTVSSGLTLEPLVLPNIFQHFEKVNPDTEYSETLALLRRASHDEASSSASAAAQAPLAQEAKAGGQQPAPAAFDAPSVILNESPGPKLLRSFASELPQSAPSPPPAASGPCATVVGTAPKKQKLMDPTATGVGPDDSASMIADSANGDDDDADDGLDMKKLRSSSSRLAALKAKVPLSELMSGVRLGRQERSVKKYLTNAKLDTTDTRLLRNHLKHVGSLMCLGGSIVTIGIRPRLPVSDVCLVS